MKKSEKQKKEGKGQEKKPVHKSEKQKKSDKLDEALSNTFPASDTPSSVQPGGGTWEK